MEIFINDKKKGHNVGPTLLAILVFLSTGLGQLKIIPKNGKSDQFSIVEVILS